jgi:hypothetical protein
VKKVRNHGTLIDKTRKKNLALTEQKFDDVSRLFENSLQKIV